MCIYCDYCVYHYKSTELVSLYTLVIGLKINIIIIITRRVDKSELVWGCKPIVEKRVVICEMFLTHRRDNYYVSYTFPRTSCTLLFNVYNMIITLHSY